MRTTGVWTTYQGEERRVSSRVDVPEIRLADPADSSRLAERVSPDDIGDVLRVTVTARWRGGEVVVSHLQGDDHVLFRTEDAALAEREGLHGDRYSGWGGAAAREELEDVREQVTVLEKGPRASCR